MKFITTEAMKEVACPRCGVGAGEPCETPSGRKLYGVNTHGERLEAYRKSIPATLFQERHAIKVSRTPFQP